MQLLCATTTKPPSCSLLQLLHVFRVVQYVLTSVTIWAECNGVIYQICAVMSKPNYMVKLQILFTVTSVHKD